MIPNNKVTINPTKLVNVVFNHKLAYNLIWYICINYDKDNKQVRLRNYNIKRYLNTSYSQIKKSIQELIDAKIIFPIEDKECVYKVNKDIFLKFVYSDKL